MASGSAYVPQPSLTSIVTSGKASEKYSSASLATNTPRDDRDTKDLLKPEPDNNASTIVDWDGPKDPENPMNWTTSRKWVITMILGCLTLIVTFASSVFSTTNFVTAAEFGVSPEVMILATSLFVLGFAFGPLVWAPLAEVYGRRNPLLWGFLLSTILQVGVAVASNVETIMLCRFLAGFFGSSPFGTIGGMLADIWTPLERGTAMAAFASATFVGPVIAPLVGSAVTESYLGWRWTLWVTVIASLILVIITLIHVPETSAKRILTLRARKLRIQTRQWALHSAAEEVPFDFGSVLSRYFTMPLLMLMREPILDLFTIYMSLVYGFLYLLLEAFPISFHEQRGWSTIVSAVPFFALIVGVIFGAIYAVWYTRAVLAPKVKQRGSLQPEDRLPPMVVGGVLLPAGMFWFAWTSNPHVPWAAQVVAGIPIGAGIILIFMQGLTYIVDVYSIQLGNSAIAANGILRAIFGAAFPLFAVTMYHDLGVAWATSLLAFLTLALVPVPVLFILYGSRIRSWSRYSPKRRPGPSGKASEPHPPTDNMQEAAKA